MRSRARIEAKEAAGRSANAGMGFDAGSCVRADCGGGCVAERTVVVVGGCADVGGGTSVVRCGVRVRGDVGGNVADVGNGT